ncbi:hypothetical protein CVT25_015684 [Psilocybe cyanescens]|uniref:Uncharacterized protein n=1 Tax=Psilocybe cyanescens TaxID=93625 RepID=A0A409XJP1_PSICY|nr:hypothetical protein CVT25_015684 [Psilocybe cyanescens]
MVSLISTVVIGFEIPVRSNRFNGQRGAYPIKLSYTSNMPTMQQSALTSNVLIVSHSKTSGNCGPQVGSHTNSIHTAIYIVFILSACALFSKTQIEISRSGHRDVAKELNDQQIFMASHRQGSMYEDLKRVIPTAATFGRAILGLHSDDEPFWCDWERHKDLDGYWEIGMRESGGPEMAAFGDLL